MIEWKAVREAASRFLTAAATWKNRNMSHVEQEGLLPMPKDRGAEQGDVDSPLRVQSGLWIGGGRDARTHSRAASGRQSPMDQRERPHRGTAIASRPCSQLAGVSKLPAWWPRKAHRCPRTAACVGVVGQWYMDDGDIMCHPILVLPFLQDFHVANARAGAERNPLKTDVIYYVNDLDAAPKEWRNGHVRSVAKTSAVTDGSITPGVAVGPRQCVTRAMHSP